jgi:hypothetical protein
MTTEKLNRANEITDVIAKLKNELFIASRETTRFVVVMLGSSENFMVEDRVLADKLLKTACDHYDAEIARLNAELEKL